MYNLIENITPIANWFFTTSLKATIIIALIMIVRLIFRDRLPAKWQHALWFLLIVRLVLPFELASPVSVFNLTKKVHAPVMPYFGEDGERERFEFERDENNRNQSVALNAQQTTGASVDSEKQFKLNWIDGLVLAWFAGVLMLIFYGLCNNARMCIKVNRAQEILDSRLLLISARCYKKLGLLKNVRMLISPEFQSPFSCGLFKPRILFPEHLLRKLSDTQLEHILLHELAHIKRRDLPIAVFTLCLQILYWFNPLVWFAFFKMRQDREMACDELVLSRLEENQSENYGRTLIALLRKNKRTRLLPVAVGLADDPSNLKRRVTMIANFSKKSMVWSLFGVMLMIVIAACALTGSEKEYNVSAKVHYNGETQPDSAWVGIYSLRHLDNNKIYSMGEPYEIVKCANKCEFTLVPGMYAVAAWAWNYDRGYKNIVIVDKETKLDIDITLDQQYIFGDYESVHLYGDFNDWTHDNAPLMTKDGEVWKITPPEDLEIGTFYKFLLKLKEPIGHINYQTCYSPAIPEHRAAITYCVFDHVYDGRNEIVFDPALLSKEEANPQIIITGGIGYEDQLQTIFSDVNKVMQNSFDTIMRNENLDANEKFVRMLAKYDSLKENYNSALSIIIDEMMLVNAYNFHPFSSERRKVFKNAKNDSIALETILSSSEFVDFAKFIKSMYDKMDMNSPFFQGEEPAISNFLFVDRLLESAPESVQNEIGLEPNYFQNQFLEFINKGHTVRANIVGTLLRFYMDRVDERPTDKDKVLAMIQILKNDYPKNWYTTTLVPGYEAQLLITIGAEAPLFEVGTVDGKIFNLSAHRGKFVFIDFWGTWCGPCRGELPNNIKLVQTMPLDKFEIIGLARDSEKDLKAFIEKENITYRNAVLTEEIERQFGVMAFPTTYLIDPDGNILAKNLRGEDLTERVQEMMNIYYEKL